MAKWLQLWHAWEVQLLVLASLILQVFLLSTGRRRRRSMNMFLRLWIWMAYLAADSVAVYVLGFLSRQVDGGASHPLAFIWAPFLLVHLGGQDSITAFAIEDNNLWLRHLLNLVVQGVLALYVFWKSTGVAWRDDARLLAPGVLVFLAGLIKYGERTMALKYGNLRSLEGSAAAVDDGGPLSLFPDDKAMGLPCRSTPEAPCCHRRRDIVSAALNSMPGVQDIFAGHTMYQMSKRTRHPFKRYHQRSCTDLSFKLVEIELAIMYDDLYTKAAVLRTRTGIVARCVSQVSTGVALVLFLVSSKQRYDPVDLAMTYLLFVGCFCLEVCSTLLVIMSPWTWDWFNKQAPRYSWLASTSWWLLSSKVGWAKETPLWSNCVGQYNFLSYLGEYQTGLWKQKLMMLARKTVSFVGLDNGYLFPISKLLDTRFEKVEEEIKASIAKVVQDYYYSPADSNKRRFKNLGPLLLPIIVPVFAKDFANGIILLHVFTEEHFRNAGSQSQETTQDVVQVCRKLSNYMMYLLVRKSEMLPVSGTTVATLKNFSEQVTGTSGSNVRDADFLHSAKQVFELPELRRCEETAMEMRDLWVRILLYAAAKSRPEINAAQLREGGELLTFAWLLMAHKEIGDSGFTRIELSAFSRQQGNGAYVFHLDHWQPAASDTQCPV